MKIITACCYAASSVLWLVLAFHGYPVQRGILSALWMMNATLIYLDWRREKIRLERVQARARSLARRTERERMMADGTEKGHVAE